MIKSVIFTNTGDTVKATVTFDDGEARTVFVPLCREYPIASQLEAIEAALDAPRPEDDGMLVRG